MMFKGLVKIEGKITKKQKKVIKTLIFITIATLPFITIASSITLEQFIESFENPDHYISLQNNNLIKSASNKGDYLIIQKSTCPDFEINKEDQIIYFENNGQIKCSTVIYSLQMGSIKRYYATNKNHTEIEPVYENQVIGKIVKTIDDNLWNTISINTWDMAIHQLNVNNFKR